jgi:hypothetical protein
LALPSTVTIHQSKKIMPSIQEKTLIASGGHKKEMVHVLIQKEDLMPIEDHENELDSYNDNQIITTTNLGFYNWLIKQLLYIFNIIVTTSSC